MVCLIVERLVSRKVRKMEQGVDEFWSALAKLGPVTFVAVCIAAVVIWGLWKRLNEKDEVIKSIYDARVKDGEANARLLREVVATMTTVIETLRNMRSGGGT